MKLRILSCAIFSCMLAACGGGSDSSDNNEPVTSQPAPTNPGTPGDGASDTISEFYNYQFNLPNIDGSEMESQKLLLASHKNKITDGILYADDNSAVDTEYDLEEDMVFSTYVTTKGVFPADRTRTALGYKLEKILENTTTQFKSRPVTIPENNISNHRHIAWYDLSGKALTERTNIAVVKMYDDPATRVFFNSDNTTAERKYYNEFATNFVDLQKARKFPNGSKCFRLLAEHPEEEYIEFDPEVKTGFSTLAEWQAQQSVQEMAKTILDDTMANLKYKKAEYKDAAMQYYKYFGAIEYQGGIYSVDFSEHGEHIDHDDYIAQSRQAALDDLNKQEGVTSLMIKWTEYMYDQLASGCDGYNATAATVLNTAIKDATPR